MCQIVEAHYFRDRFSIGDFDQKAERDHDPDYANKQLRNERAFDDVLMRANIATHYFSIDARQQPPKEV